MIFKVCLFFPAPKLCGTVMMLYVCLSCLWEEKGNKIEPKNAKQY